MYGCTFCRGTNTGKRNSSVLYALEFLFPVSKIILKWLRIWSPAITFLKEGIFIWDQLSNINQLMIWGPAITFLKEGIFDSELIIYGINFWISINSIGAISLTLDFKMGSDYGNCFLLTLYFKMESDYGNCLSSLSTTHTAWLLLILLKIWCNY